MRKVVGRHEVHILRYADDASSLGCANDDALGEVSHGDGTQNIHLLLLDIAAPLGEIAVEDFRPIRGESRCLSLVLLTHTGYMVRTLVLQHACGHPNPDLDWLEAEILPEPDAAR